MNLLKKTSLFLMAFFIGYPILYLIQFWQVKNQSAALDTARFTTIAQMLSHSREESSEDLFLNMFDVYLKTDAISYYVIRHQDGRLLYPSSERALVKENESKAQTNLQARSEINVGQQKYVVFFGKDDFPVFIQLQQLLNEQKTVLFFFLLGICLLIYKVAAYFLNFDIANIIQWFKSRSGTSEVEILSSEAQKLKNFIHGIEQQRTLAETMVQEYRDNAYSGLTWAHDQIKAGVTKAHITVGRCDINNFTVLKQKYSPELLNYIVQSFFNRGGEYLNRYGAYKESAAGDEITFFVPESESVNPHLNALHVIRGLFEIFEDLKVELAALDQPLTVKASLDYGSTELEKMGGNAETDGEPYIITERILKTVEANEKEKSILVILTGTKDHYGDHISIHHESSEKVKNYESLKKVSFVQTMKSYRSLVKGINSEENQSLHDLQYFKTDKDILNILKDMEEMISMGYLHLFNVLRAHIASLKITRTSQSVTEQFNRLLDTAMAAQSDNLLSGVVMLAKTLFSPDSVSKELLHKIQGCLQSKNKRVAANAREALFHLKPNLVELAKFVKSENNRMAADSLIDLIKINGLTDPHTEILLEWLNSKNKDFQLSALYAVCMVSRHWITLRPDYVALNHNFKKTDAVVRQMDRTDPHLLKWLKLYDEANVLSA